MTSPCEHSQEFSGTLYDCKNTAKCQHQIAFGYGYFCRRYSSLFDKPMEIRDEDEFEGGEDVGLAEHVRRAGA